MHDLAEMYSMPPLEPVHGRIAVIDQPVALLKLHRILTLGRRRREVEPRAPGQTRGRREELVAEQRARATAARDADEPLGPFAAAVLGEGAATQ